MRAADEGALRRQQGAGCVLLVVSGRPSLAQRHTLFAPSPCRTAPHQVGQQCVVDLSTQEEPSASATLHIAVRAPCLECGVIALQQVSDHGSVHTRLLVLCLPTSFPRPTPAPPIIVCTRTPCSRTPITTGRPLRPRVQRGQGGAPQPAPCGGARDGGDGRAVSAARRARAQRLPGDRAGGGRRAVMELRV